MVAIQSYSHSGAEKTGLGFIIQYHSFLFFFLILKKFLATPRGMWDLSSLTRDRNHAPCIGSTES